jgi:hypothetical protein
MTLYVARFDPDIFLSDDVIIGLISLSLLSHSFTCAKKEGLNQVICKAGPIQYYHYTSVVIMCNPAPNCKVSGEIDQSPERQLQCPMTQNN